MRYRRRPRATPGFTLIELTAVIALCVALAAVVTATYLHVRGKSHQSACVANLRQLGTAFRLYANDHEGLSPPYFTECDVGGPEAATYADGALFELMRPYGAAAETWLCPADPFAGRTAPYANCRVDHRLTSYVALCGWTGQDILSPPEWAVFESGPLKGLPHILAFDELAWHFGGREYLLLDGSVQWVREPREERRHRHPLTRH
ncbi:MAG: type II secretion system protein [Armatimonadota bacterium]|nr:MAG: type II secretion system protein [Armatimonadota bacterium]